MGDCLAICDETKPGADGPDPRETPPTEGEIEMPAVVSDQQREKSFDCLARPYLPHERNTVGTVSANFASRRALLNSATCSLSGLASPSPIVQGRGFLLSSSLPRPPYDRESRAPLRRSRVLIVDDNCFVRQALTEIFKREADFDVCGEACNGQEAVRVAQLLGPDLIVLDLAMPVMNGLDAARMLRRLMPAVPLIMYSGIGDKFVEQQARLIGIAALISKGEAPGTLVGQARSLLSQRHGKGDSDKN